MKFGNRQMISHRIQQTEEGYSADRLRIDLLVASIKTGLANPIIGVSPNASVNIFL